MSIELFRFVQRDEDGFNELGRARKHRPDNRPADEPAPQPSGESQGETSHELPGFDPELLFVAAVLTALFAGGVYTAKTFFKNRAVVA